MSTRLYNAFGYLWRFNAVSTESKRRWYLLPTISVYMEETTYAGHDIRYWAFDLLWLKLILTIEVEQLHINR